MGAGRASHPNGLQGSLPLAAAAAAAATAQRAGYSLGKWLFGVTFLCLGILYCPLPQPLVSSQEVQGVPWLGNLQGAVGHPKSQARATESDCPFWAYAGGDTWGFTARE